MKKTLQQTEYERDEFYEKTQMLNNAMEEESERIRLGEVA